jgi:hypothetical protein
LPKRLYYLQKRSIIPVITIIVKKLFLFALCVAASSIGLHQGAAQQADATPAPAIPSTIGAAPASLLARNTAVTSIRPARPPLPVNASAQQPNRTKVVRVYGGAGYFDITLAEKLRPGLARGFASAKSTLVKAASGEVSVPTKAESQNKAPPLSNL